MIGYDKDYWDHPREINGATEKSPTLEFSTAVRTLDRLSEKVRRFYQSGDFEEVVLNAHQIKELYQLCLRDEYRRQGRNNFRPALRAHIESNLDSLNYWWETGVVAFQKIKIGPEIAKTAMMLSEEMRDYLMSYVDYQGGDTLRASQAISNSSSYEAQLRKKPVASLSPYPIRKGGLKIDEEGLLYLGRPSIVGCLLAYKWILLLLITLLFGSFFVNSISEISFVAILFRGISVLLFLFVVGRTGIAVYSERYAITEQDLHIEKGLFFKSTTTIPLIRVTAQTIQQSLLGKLLRTGNLIIKTNSGHVVAFKGIYDPEEVFDLVVELRQSKTYNQG
ncbi:MAG: PH domain-containing protein [Halobacteriota archaeon]